MPVQIPFPIPSHGYALNSKMRINLEFLVDQFNEFNTGSATWDTVAIGTANNLTGTLTFWNSSNAHYLTFQAGATAVDTTYTWPTALPITSSKHLLTSTNAGIMAWDTNEWLVTADQPGVLITGIAGAGTIINIHNTLGAEGFVRMDNDTTNPKFVTLLGTSSQVIVTHNTLNTTLSLPQSIGTSSSVSFQAVTVEAGSLGSESLKLGSGPTVGGIFNNSGVLSFTTGGTLRATIDGGGNITAVGNLLGQGLKLEETGAGTDTITIQAPASIAASYTLTLPVDDGNNLDFLQTNGSGVLSWVAGSSGANTALSNLAAVAINTTLVSDTNNTDDLGTSSIRWKIGYFADTLSTISAKSGGDVAGIFQNTSNTSASGAAINLIVGGSSAGDPYIQFNTGTDWTIGCDNSDSDKFKISNNASLGTTDILTLATSTGLMTLTGGITAGSAISSDTNNTDDLGTSTINWRSLYLATSIKNGSTTLATVTELGYLTGVTSAIQTQIDAKAPSASPTFTGTVTVPNGSSATNAAAFGQIKYFQAPVQGTKTTSFSTTSSTYQATGLTASITPTSASNRIKVTVSFQSLDSANPALAFAYVTVKRGSTDLSNGSGFAANAGTTGVLQYISAGSFSYIDSPATTSSTTYEVYLKNDNNSTTVRMNGLAGTCTIILEEVA